MSGRLEAVDLSVDAPLMARGCHEWGTRLWLGWVGGGAWATRPGMEDTAAAMGESVAESALRAGCVAGLAGASMAGASAVAVSMAGASEVAAASMAAAEATGKRSSRLARLWLRPPQRLRWAFLFAGGSRRGCSTGSGSLEAVDLSVDDPLMARGCHEWGTRLWLGWFGGGAWATRQLKVMKCRFPVWWKRFRP